MITRNFLFIGLASVIPSVPVATAEEAVKQHLATGADVNAKNERRWTPLHIATTKEIAELLIAAGADVNAKDKIGRVPLDAAIYGKKPETADLLRKHGGKTSEELKAEGK